MLSNIGKRRRVAADWLRNGRQYVDGYGGIPRNLNGLSADWNQRTLTLPEGLTETAQRTIRNALMPQLPSQNRMLTRYRAGCLGKIVELSRDSATSLIFVELPRAQLSKPESIVPATFMKSIEGHPGVHIASPEMFRFLETPDTFAVVFT